MSSAGNEARFVTGQVLAPKTASRRNEKSKKKPKVKKEVASEEDDEDGTFSDDYTPSESETDASNGPDEESKERARSKRSRSKKVHSSVNLRNVNLKTAVDQSDLDTGLLDDKVQVIWYTLSHMFLLNSKHPLRTITKTSELTS